MKPICFVVMPFGVKDVPREFANAPPRVDFDRLWRTALQPAIEALGYEAVRADQDLGALIIHEMLERLYFADLVLADMSIPNGNVYYEIGVRHAARPDGCVLIAADWALPLFDASQMRRISYPLPQESISGEQAQAIQAVLTQQVPQLRDGASPVFQVLPGYPTPSADRAHTLRNEVARFVAFCQRLQTVSLAPDAAAAKAQALAIAAEHPAPQQVMASVAAELVQLLRDHAGWDEVANYVLALPEALNKLPCMQEQLALAQSKQGDHAKAIAGLQSLIQLQGETEERRGLIGGRYKKLAAEARARQDPAAHLKALNRSIDSYESGMRLALGSYYCVSNLARLLRERGEPGDHEQALFYQKLTVLMVESALARGKADEWARPTLLAAAFDAGDVVAARQAAKRVKHEGAALWKLDSTLADLKLSVAHAQDPAVRASLQGILDDLSA
jgi:hypothetical protein